MFNAIVAYPESVMDFIVYDCTWIVEPYSFTFKSYTNLSGDDKCLRNIFKSDREKINIADLTLFKILV